MEIKEIDKRTAQDMVVRYHYLHRKASCSIAYGAFVNGKIIGVCMFGTPASPSVCTGLCGPQERNSIMELTRLWISDEISNYPESTLIAGSLKLLRNSEYASKDIIISYADTSQGHIGTIYQATNWYYLGLTAKHIEYKVDGMSGHSRHYFDSLGGVNKAKKILGSKITVCERPRKHRYLFLNTKSRQRKRIILDELNYDIQPYPKNKFSQKANLKQI